MFKFVDINVWINAAAGSTNFVGLLDGCDSPNKHQQAIKEASGELVMSEFSLGTLARKTGSEAEALRQEIPQRGGVIVSMTDTFDACGQVLAALDDNLLALKCQEWKRTGVRPSGKEQEGDNRIDFEDVMVLAAALASRKGTWSATDPTTWVQVITEDRGMLAAQTAALRHLGIALLRP